MEKNELKPAGVFHYFDEICQVPRPSKKEEKMIAYLKAFGEKHKLETLVDEAGNVLIKKPATPGMENRKTVEMCIRDRNKRLYDSTAISSISECGLGFQPG